MIKMSGRPSGEASSAMVIVAYDTANGDVRATYVYVSDGEMNEDAARAREKLLKDVRERLGSDASVDVTQVGLVDLEPGWIERVDPTTHAVVIRSGRDATTGISRP